MKKYITMEEISAKMKEMCKNNLENDEIDKLIIGNRCFTIKSVEMDIKDSRGNSILTPINGNSLTIKY